MSKRFVPFLLWTLGLLALAGSSFVLYNFAFNDWRVDGDFLSAESVRAIFQGDDRSDDSTRLAGWEFPLSDSAIVEIDAALCTISILPSGNDLAEIRLILSGDAVDTTLYQASSRSTDSSSLSITARPTQRWNGSSRGLVEIEILLPARSRLAIRLRTGDIRVDRMVGGMRLEMSDGAFEGTDLGGEIALRNAKGSVRLERSSAHGTIELRSGKVDLMFNNGDLVVAATDAVEARTHFAALDVSTVEGAIIAEIVSDHPRCRLQSDKGMIQLKLLPGAHATIAARSATPLVAHQLPLDLPDSVAVTPFSVVSPLNGGGDSVLVQTRSGAILLETFGPPVVRAPRFEIPHPDTGSEKSEE